VVGDTPLDIAAALSAGARAVGVATGSFSAADLVAAGAHAVLPDLTDTSLVLDTLLGQPSPRLPQQAFAMADDLCRTAGQADGG
jgi:hypothetical protein